jgi:hypothetical protein
VLWVFVGAGGDETGVLSKAARRAYDGVTAFRAAGLAFVLAIVAAARMAGRLRRATASSRAPLCEPRSEAALASVSAQGAGDLRRLAPLLQRCDPLVFADRLSMDGVLEPLEERFKPVDPPLQDFNAPLMPRSRRLGGRVRGPPAAAQLDDTAEDRRATPHGPTRIAATRHRRKPPTASFS